MINAHRNGRPNRTRSLGVEGLEGRALLTHSALAVPVNIAIQLSQNYVTKQSGAVVVKLTRSSSIAEYKNRLTVNVATSATDIPPGADTSATVPTAGQDPATMPIVPIDGAYTFQRGQTSLKIRLLLNPNDAATGETDVQVAASPPPGNAPTLNPVATATLHIESSPALLPPTIVPGSQTEFLGNAINLVFSKPMDQSTAENINNYLVVANYARDARHPNPIPTVVHLLSAITGPPETVTLFTPDNLDLRDVVSYQVSSPAAYTPGQPPPAGTQVLTDLQGKPIDGNGVFKVTVKPFSLSGVGEGGVLF